MFRDIHETHLPPSLNTNAHTARYYFFLQFPNLSVYVALLVVTGLDVIEAFTTEPSEYFALCANFQKNPGVPCLPTILDERNQSMFEPILWWTVVLLFVVYTTIAWYRLSHRPWRKYASVNISLRLHILQSTPILMGVVAVKMVKVYQSVSDRCGNEYDEVMIQTPEIILLVTGWACIRAFTSAPIMIYECRRQIRYRVLSNFLWVERNFHAIDSHSFWADSIGTDEYNSEYCDYGSNKTLGAQPVFCFETMVKMLFWAEVTYLENPETAPAASPAPETSKDEGKEKNAGSSPTSDEPRNGSFKRTFGWSLAPRRTKGGGFGVNIGDQLKESLDLNEKDIESHRVRKVGLGSSTELRRTAYSDR